MRSRGSNPRVATMDTNSAKTERLTYSVAEAAQAVGISRRTIYELLRSRQLASIKIGSRRLIRSEELVRFLAELEDAA